MSIHRSLRGGSGMGGHRNVLTRIERLGKLESDGRWDESKGSVCGLPKVRSIKAVVKKKKKKKEGEEEAAAGTAAATAAAPAAGAAAKK